MLAFNSKILTLASLSFVVYLMFSNTNIKSGTMPRLENIPFDTEARIKQIREEASGKAKIANEKEWTLQEKIAHYFIEYIVGKEFVEKFVKHG